MKAQLSHHKKTRIQNKLTNVNHKHNYCTRQDTWQHLQNFVTPNIKMAASQVVGVGRTLLSYIGYIYMVGERPIYTIYMGKHIYKTIQTL